MAKSRRFDTDERRHDDESPAHKKRREERHHLALAKSRELDELEEEEFDHFEPIKRKGGKR